MRPLEPRFQSFFPSISFSFKFKKEIGKKENLGSRSRLGLGPRQPAKWEKEVPVAQPSLRRRRARIKVLILLPESSPLRRQRLELGEEAAKASPAGRENFPGVTAWPSRPRDDPSGCYSEGVYDLAWNLFFQVLNYNKKEK